MYILHSASSHPHPPHTHTHPSLVKIKVTDRIFEKQNVQYQASYPVWQQVLFLFRHENVYYGYSLEAPQQLILARLYEVQGELL